MGDIELSYKKPQELPLKRKSTQALAQKSEADHKRENQVTFMHLLCRLPFIRKILWFNFKQISPAVRAHL